MCKMNVGNLVKVKFTDSSDVIGIIIDLFEGSDGWCYFEVVYAASDDLDVIGWFSDLQLEVL